MYTCRYTHYIYSMIHLKCHTGTTGKEIGGLGTTQASGRKENCGTLHVYIT